MKKVLYVVLALSVVLMLSVGTAMAKTQDGEKGNAGGIKATVQNDTVTPAASEDVESQEAVQVDKFAPGQQLKEFKQKLAEYLANGEAELNIPDIKGHWAEKSIQKMEAIGVFKGYEDGTFRPEDSITQDEAVVMLMRLVNKDVEQEDETVDADVYELADVPDWAKASVEEAVYKGVVNLNRFHSQKQADRAQVAVQLAKTLNLTPVDTTDVPFVDGILITQEDLGYIMALYQEKIIVGSPDGTFNPDSAITRAEMATIMERVLSQAQLDQATTTTTESTTN